MNLPTIILGPVDPIPESLDLTAPTMTLNGVGSTVQLTVTATFPDGSSADMTASSTGTNYTSTSPAIATVSDDGLVTALLSGNIIVSSMQCATLPL